MLIEIKDYWFVETSVVTGIRLSVKGWWKKYPVIRIDTHGKPIILSDFDTEITDFNELEDIIEDILTKNRDKIVKLQNLKNIWEPMQCLWVSG